MIRTKVEKYSPRWFRIKLRKLSLQAKEAEGQAKKAMQNVVRYAVDMGIHLNEAQRLLKDWKKRAKAGEEQPPKWEDWLKANFSGSWRTANVYQQLADDPRIEAKINDPDFSIRKALRILKGFEKGKEQPVDSKEGEGSEEQKPTEYEGALWQLRELFRETLKEWPEELVVYLGQNPGDFEELLANLAAEADPLAQWWRKAKRKEKQARHQAFRQGKGHAIAEQEEAAAEVRKSSVMELWQKFRDREDRSDWQERKVAQVVEPYTQELPPADRKTLEHFTRNGKTTRNGRVNGQLNGHPAG